MLVTIPSLASPLSATFLSLAFDETEKQWVWNVHSLETETTGLNIE